MATLEEFLRAGVLGSVHPEMKQTEAIDLLGSPQDCSVARHPQILKYGGLQLTFIRRPMSEDRELAHVGLYFFPQAEPIPEPVRPSDFACTSETTIADVRDFLLRVGLEGFAVEEGDETNHLILPSGARIVFQEQKLRSIHFASRRREAAKKQLSLSLPKDLWDQLNLLARQSRRSLSDLCAEWITQRALELQHIDTKEVGHIG